jgi:hypothetical protein
VNEPLDGLRGDDPGHDQQVMPLAAVDKISARLHRGGQVEVPALLAADLRDFLSRLQRPGGS